MSLTPVSSDQSSSIGTLLLQQLNALGSSSSSQSASGLAGILGDLMTLSPEAQQLTKAPEDVTKALSDLLTTQKDVSGDIEKLKTYFKQNPQSLANVLGSLQGGATYGASGANSALLTALMNSQSKNSNPAALLTLLQGSKTTTLFDALGDSGGSDSSLAIFG